MNLTELKQTPTRDLARLAEESSISGADTMRRQELIFSLLEAEIARGGSVIAEGVLETLPDGFGFLRAPDCNYQPGSDDIYVSPSQIRRFNLRTGDTVTGQVRAPKENERYFALLRVEQVNHTNPEADAHAAFDTLTAVAPSERLSLEHNSKELSTRMVDLLCPIGRGQRVLISGGPRTGKTAMLWNVARGLAANVEDAKVIALLIDERPEEITAAERAVRGEVIGTTFDEQPSRHVQIAELVVEKAKRTAEAGKDVVLLLDSVTSLARAYAAVGEGSSLVRPRRALGAGRKLEKGGSLTLVATASADPTSRADAIIHDDLRTMPSCTIYLDGQLADRRIYPCIDILRSGTAGEEALIPNADLAKITNLRRELADLPPIDAAIELRRRLHATDTNAALLANIKP